MSRLAACVLALVCAAPFGALAQSAEDLLASALEAYASGLDAADRDQRLENYRRAARFFSAVVEGGVENADLYTNLGNASLLGERHGDAVLAYRRALALDPDHRGARKNLEHARELLPVWVPRPERASVLDSFFFWHRALSSAERAGFGALMFALGASLLAAAIYWRRVWLRNLALVPGVAWAATMVSLTLGSLGGAAPEAVITAPEVIARAADSVNAPTRFARPLPGGVEVGILERREGWVRIGMADGRDAWVAATSLTPVAPD